MNRRCSNSANRASKKRQQTYLSSRDDSSTDTNPNFTNYKFQSNLSSAILPSDNSEQKSNQTKIIQEPLLQTISTKFCTNLPIMHPQPTEPEKFTEQSLFDLGYSMDDNPNWDKIEQPKKRSLIDLLMAMIKNYEKTNVQIKINDTIFNCHMIVLQCYSDFFMDLNNETVIVLPVDKVSARAFFMIYDWMLSSHPIVQRDGLLELFSAAQFLKIQELIEQCWSCIDSNDHFFEDAAFLLYLEARKYGYEMIKKLMFERISKFFLSAVASKEFLNLTSTEVCALLESNTIGINCETEILLTAIRWLNHNWSEREQHLSDLIKCVRFCLMNPYQLIEIKNCNSLEIQQIVKYPQVIKMIDDAISYVTAKYWHSNDSMSIIQLMEKLNITEPHERQWIHDEKWIKEICTNQIYTSYDTFLDYLEMIQALGKNHWKGLKCRQSMPCNGIQSFMLREQNGKTHLSKKFLKETVQPLAFNPISPNDPLDCVVLFEGDLFSCDTASNNNLPTAFVDTSNDHKIPQIRNQVKKKNRLQLKNRTKIKNSESKWFVEDCPSEINQGRNHEILNKNLNQDLRKDYVCDPINDQNLYEYKPVKDQISNRSKDRYNDNPAFQRTTNLNGNGCLDTNDCQIILDPTFDALSINTECGNSIKSSARRMVSMTEFNYFPGDPKILIFGGVTDINCQNSERSDGKIVWQYSKSKNSWEEQSMMPKKRYNHSAVFYQSRIFIAGGMQFNGNEWEITKSMWSYDPLKRCWYSEQSMPYAVQNFGFVEAHLQIYAIGGENADQCPRRTVYRYDPATAVWTTVSSMHIERTGAAIATYKSLIWVVGGKISANDQTFTRSVECYDPITDQWTISKNLRIPRSFGRMCLVDGYLYIVGGLCQKSNGQQSSMSTIDYFDFKHKTWKLLDELQLARHGHSVVNIGSQILIIGGVSVIQAKQQNLKSVECFCTNRLIWIHGFQELPMPKIGAAVVTIP